MPGSEYSSDHGSVDSRPGSNPDCTRKHRALRMGCMLHQKKHPFLTQKEEAHSFFIFLFTPTVPSAISLPESPIAHDISLPSFSQYYIPSGSTYLSTSHPTMASPTSAGYLTLGELCLLPPGTCRILESCKNKTVEKTKLRIQNCFHHFSVIFIKNGSNTMFFFLMGSILP